MAEDRREKHSQGPLCQRGVVIAGLFALLSVSATPALAAGEIVVEASLGQGLQLSPRPAGAATTTSLMVAPGYGFHPAVRLSLGLAAVVDALDAGAFDLEIRPMLTLTPPSLPIYVRLVAAIVQLIRGPVTVAFGGAVGAQGRLDDLGLFAELALLPQAGLGPGGHPKVRWLVEARAGGSLHF